jgi:hypothetical protein
MKDLKLNREGYESCKVCPRVITLLTTCQNPGLTRCQQLR